jgi:hypothetical protein
LVNLKRRMDEWSWGSRATIINTSNKTAAEVAAHLVKQM